MKLKTPLHLLLAIWLLPSYALAAYWWHSKHGAWVWVNPIRYAELSKDWLSFSVSWAVWAVILLIATLTYQLLKG